MRRQSLSQRYASWQVCVHFRASMSKLQHAHLPPPSGPGQARSMRSSPTSAMENQNQERSSGWNETWRYTTYFCATS